MNSSYFRFARNIAFPKRLGRQYFRSSKFITLLGAISIIGGINYISSTDEYVNINNFLKIPSPNLSHCSSERYTYSQLKEILGQRLKGIRERLKRSNSAIPPLTARELFSPDRRGFQIETHVLDIKISPKDSDLSKLLSFWFKILYLKDQELIDSKVLEAKDFYENKKHTNISFVSPEKESSLTLSKFYVNGKPQISISIFKDDGFGVEDIEFLVKGYEGGFLVPKSNWTFAFDDTREAFGFPKDNIFSLFKGFGAPGTEEYGPGESAVNKEITPDNAVSTLRELGIEVFDKQNNQNLNWDSLAGYDYVKQNIEDTLLNAIKYPEIYDKIARKTRAVYESNRPKAVLFEGPPGTGKTLTARILASQCDATLIVLKIDSIVSKWYGDSEKKLSKILDACDALENCIIFIDEIDAFASSRDSEQGIHEVTKRILSVLLQRLEGFHGKSKSILICATNRKQDLDRALISRFDLTIQYVLPDFSTREEIFKRYAQQFVNIKAIPFNGSPIEPYKFFADNTEGLSCRDLKEICQQAERICASRLVKQYAKNAKAATNGIWGNKINNSELSEETPKLEDYILSIKMKMEQQGNPNIQGFSNI